MLYTLFEFCSVQLTTVPSPVMEFTIVWSVITLGFAPGTWFISNGTEDVTRIYDIYIFVVAERSVKYTISDAETDPEIPYVAGSFINASAVFLSLT